MPEQTTPPPTQTPEATPPAQTAAATPESANAEQAPALSDDPVWNGMMAGLGLAVGKPAPPAPTTESEPTVGRTLSDSLKVADEARERETPAAATETANASAAASTATTATEPAQPAAKIEVVKKPSDKGIAETVEKALKKVLKETAPTPPTATVQPAQQTAAPDPFESRLTEAEREELSFARYAAKNNPKYQEYPDKLMGYFKAVNDYVEKGSRENPDRTFDEQDEEFAKFARSRKPAFDPVDRRRMERKMVVDETVAAARQEQQKEIEEQRERIHRLENMPKVENAVRTFATESEKYFASDENSPMTPILKRAKEVGWNETLKEDRIFAPIVKDYQDHSTKLAGEYVALFTGVKKFDPSNPDHGWMLEFARKQAETFQRNGGDARVRDGKQFLPPVDYVTRMNSDRTTPNDFWTFNDRDILERLAQNTKANIEDALKIEQERLSASGFERKNPTNPKNGLAQTETRTAITAAKPAPQSSATAEQTSPKTTPSSAPGAAKTGATPQNSAFPPGLFGALGLKVPA